MSRTALKLACVVIGVGCLVVIVRAQDGEPGKLPMETTRASISDSEPTPAAPMEGEYRPRFGEPTPASPAEFQTTPAPAETTGSAPTKRPSAAERLQQVRTGTSKGSPRSTTIVAPVTEDPTGLRTQTNSPELITPSRSSKPLSVTESESGGGSSVLKKPDSDSNSAPSSDRHTARRILRAPTKTNSTAAPKAAQTPVAPVATPTRKPVSTGEVIDSKGPSLRLETTGPKTLKLGSEATYTIHVHNEGDVEAHDVFVRAGLPSSAMVTVEGAAAESGQAADAPNEQRFVWSIARLAPRGTETLTLKVIPTENKPLDLFVDWTIRPISALAQIEVQQPQLELSVFGPKDIAYGEAAKYTIRLSNPGNGDADNITVEFGYGQEKLEPKTIKTLAAGQQQEISLELTARQSGALPVVAIATSSGGLRAEASQEVLVRRAALETEITGDATTFAGSPANYRIIVRNAGNAAANQVAATITLPEGSQVVGGGDETKPTPNGLLWSLGILPPNAERTLEIQAMLSVAGDHAVNVRTSATGDLEAMGSFVTHVEALADLKLTVNDPQGPVAVGQECVYEVHISNRGTKAATKINVIAQFSPGIEPVDATGSPAELVAGQVLFQAIPRIDPGQEVILIVRAKADSAGPKRFRAEVSCEDLDTQLVAQETTHFFADSSNKTGKAKTNTSKR